MSYNISNDAEPPPAPNPPGISESNLRLFQRAGAVLAVIVLVLLILWWVRAVYTDWLWFSQLGFSGVFVKVITTRIVMFVVGAVVSAIIISVSVFFAYRYSDGPVELPLAENVVDFIRRLVFWGSILAVIILSIAFGAILASRWEIFGHPMYVSPLPKNLYETERVPKN